MEKGIYSDIKIGNLSEHLVWTGFIAF